MGAVFKFKLGEPVLLTVSGERGRVIGRADYQSSEPDFLIRYKAGDGRAVESWWKGDALESV